MNDRIEAQRSPPARPFWSRGNNNEYGVPVYLLLGGGLRGGISVALAQSIPAAPERTTIVIITYIVVVFSIGIQGKTLGKLASKIYPGIQTPSDQPRP